MFLFDQYYKAACSISNYLVSGYHNDAIYCVGLLFDLT